MPISHKSTPKTETSRSSLAANIAAVPQRHDNDNPLWLGPCGAGPLGGITQSMLVRFLSCRERFRLRYVLGLEPHDRWNHRLGYGTMWHAAEETFAATNDVDRSLIAARGYCNGDLEKHRLQHEEINKWYSVLCVQFPEYVKYWSNHPDVLNRTPLMQEQVFDVPYQLPSGRVVRLRGKDDSVDLITDEVTGPEGGVYLQENKSKGDIDKLQIERQLKFDLQTMLYLVALLNQPSCDLPREGYYRHGGGISKGGTVTSGGAPPGEYRVMGVRYNVVRRPLSGGKGNIKPHAAKASKYKMTPAETADEFYERLRRDYIAADPAYWFFRVRAEVSARDVQVFRDTCLDPLLETVCGWYEQLTGEMVLDPPYNYRTPFGVYSALEEGGATEYDSYLETGSEAGLERVEKLFPELQ